MVVLPRSVTRSHLGAEWRTEHDAMPVSRPDSKLSHTPRFVAQTLHEFGPLGLDRAVEVVDSAYHDVGKVGMIAQVPWRERIGALSRHDGAVVAFEEKPARIAERPHSEAKDVAVELGGRLQLGHRDHEASLSEIGHQFLMPYGLSSSDVMIFTPVCSEIVVRCI
jgi:hypothetical protein